MLAAVHDRYGPPEVVHLREVPDPMPGPGEVLVRVRAAGVTTADWRLRAAAFPGALVVPGRLIAGLRRPRHPVLGGDFAGEVAAVGPGAAGFAPGDRVFGTSGFGAHAERVAVRASGAVAPIPAAPGHPAGLPFAEAAALPFGALAALVALRDAARLRAGERLLVMGASGGVGVCAVQIGAAIGARVTGTASPRNHDLLRALGAERAWDYADGPVPPGPPFDVALDAAGFGSFSAVRPRLAPGGRFVPLTFGLREIGQALGTMRAGPGGRSVRIATVGERRADLDAVAAMVAAGTLRPVIDRRYPFAAVAEAHRHVEGRRRSGAVILEAIGGG